MLIAGLHKDANNPSKELELRTKSYQLQQHIHAMASEGLEWDGASVDKLAKLAADMAVTSGKLDQTLADDKMVLEFFKNATATAFHGITQAIEAVSETANLMGSVLLGTTRAINGVQKSLLRTEMLGLYLGYMIYYLIMGNWAEKLGFWGMPLVKPVGPIIAMEWMAKSAVGVEPSMTTPFIMMFLFYLVWDRQKVDPLTNSISSLFGMCRRSAPIAPNGVQQAPNGVRQVPNGAPNGVQQARNVPPVVQQAPHPVVQHPAPPLQVNARPLQGPSSSSSSKRATTPKRVRSGQASASSRNSGQASASYRPSSSSSSSRSGQASASYRNQGFSSSSYRPSSSSSSSKAPLTPRSHVTAAQQIAANHLPHRNSELIHEIMLYQGLNYETAARHVRENPPLGGRRTRKNKRQNRRRTRK
jgi:hypothetical protein